MGGKVLELESERLMAIGEAKGEDLMAKLIAKLMESGKTEDIRKVTSDASVREEYYKQYGIK